MISYPVNYLNAIKKSFFSPHPVYPLSTSYSSGLPRPFYPSGPSPKTRLLPKKRNLTWYIIKGVLEPQMTKKGLPGKPF